MTNGKSLCTPRPEGEVRAELGLPSSVVPTSAHGGPVLRTGLCLLFRGW